MTEPSYTDPRCHKPVWQASDAELLKELWKRDRFVKLVVKEVVDDTVIQRNGNEEGFWRSVHSRLFRSIGKAIEGRRADLVHQSSRPVTGIFRSTEFNKSVWIIRNPTGGCIR